MKFGNLVKLKRAKKNKTLQQLAEDADISSSYVSRIENDPNKSPSAESVFKLAEALDISMLELQDCFEVKLNEADNDSSLNLIEQRDYVLIKQAEEIMINIANNKEDYHNAIKKLFSITERLKKTQVQVICSLEDVDYVVNVRLYERHIVETVKDMLRSSFSGRIRVVEGYFLENSEANYFELEEFIELMQEIDAVNEFEIKDLINYLKKINY